MTSRRMYTENEIRDIAGGSNIAEGYLDQLTRWTKATADSPITILDKTHQVVWTKHPIVIPFLNQPPFTIYEDLADHLGWEMDVNGMVVEIDGQYYTSICAYFVNEENTITARPCSWDGETFQFNRDIPAITLYTPEDKWLKEKYRHWKFIAFDNDWQNNENPFGGDDRFIRNLEDWWYLIVETPVDYDDYTYVYIADKMKYNIGPKYVPSLSFGGSVSGDSHKVFPFVHQKLKVSYEISNCYLDLSMANYSIFDIYCSRDLEQDPYFTLIAGQHNVFGLLPDGTLIEHNEAFGCPTYRISVNQSPTDSPTNPTVRIIVKDGVIDVQSRDLYIEESQE